LKAVKRLNNNTEFIKIVQIYIYQSQYPDHLGNISLLNTKHAYNGNCTIPQTNYNKFLVQYVCQYHLSKANALFCTVRQN
jgi:hypothetical protein